LSPAASSLAPFTTPSTNQLFYNNIIEIWDVAAGEALIRAIGSKVTDYLGCDID
jgi:3'-phosphoadenosine 5'-phosphosulfate (PAPS) 3'-phosphatase